MRHSYKSKNTHSGPLHKGALAAQIYQQLSRKENPKYVDQLRNDPGLLEHFIKGQIIRVVKDKLRKDIIRQTVNQLQAEIDLPFLSLVTLHLQKLEMNGTNINKLMRLIPICSVTDGNKAQQFLDVFKEEFEDVISSEAKPTITFNEVGDSDDTFISSDSESENDHNFVPSKPKVSSFQEPSLAHNGLAYREMMAAKALLELKDNNLAAAPSNTLSPRP